MATVVPFLPHDSTGNHRFKSDFKGDQAPKRNLIVWQAPHLGQDRYIEMYVNPQSIAFSNKKAITQKRTKGGFLVQYWGEDLETLNITGETGDGGIEALYALLDVYRSEQLAFEQLVSSAATNSQNLFKQRQPLAPLAMATVMWYMGEGRRGFFTEFQYDESVSKNGSISYRMGFTVLEQINKRKNFMPWHRKPWSTTETPVVASNGRLVVTGGYEGEPDKRVGQLNSPSGKIEYIPVTTTTPDGLQKTTFAQSWTLNKLLDPKPWKEVGEDNMLQTTLDAKAAKIDKPENEKILAKQEADRQEAQAEQARADELRYATAETPPLQPVTESTANATGDAAVQSGSVTADPAPAPK